MLNWIFLILVAGSVMVASHLNLVKEVSSASVTSAKTAVDIAIGLIGQMALWLGLMKILEEAGLLRAVARGMKPVMTRLFPDVPSDHPAMAAMILNLAANMVGLTNAATPFGLRAMVELNKLNQKKGVATDAMVLFLAINTSGVAVLPLGAIATRAALGAKNLTGIVVPTILATSCSTLTAILVVKLIQRLRWFRAERYEGERGEANTASESTSAGGVKGSEGVKGIEDAEKMAEITAPKIPPAKLALIALVLGTVLWGFVRHQGAASEPVGLFSMVKELLEGWLLPLLMLAILLFGFGKSVKVYETLVKGAKEGFNIAVMIIPFMVAILVAIGMFRASGAMDLLVNLLVPVTSLVGFPAEALPMALIRPLSGSGALAVMTETMKVYGPDSFVGFLVCVINGSMETTFYVLAVYYGSVQVRATRHTVIVCLAADLAGIIGALIFSRLFF